MRRPRTSIDIEEIVKLAWADDIPFTTISKEYGLTENQIVALMRKHQSPRTYVRWRQRVRGRQSKQLPWHTMKNRNYSR
jgi:uncharacterized protein (TIGR03643 family)